MAQALKEHFIAYLESVRATPDLPSLAIQELDDGIKLLKKANHITFPYSGDAPLITADKVRNMMDTFFRKYPNLMATQQQIDLQELNFQRFIQNTGLLKTSQSPRKR